jgi:hypothetical protein
MSLLNNIKIKMMYILQTFRFLPIGRRGAIQCRRGLHDTRRKHIVTGGAGDGKIGERGGTGWWYRKGARRSQGGRSGGGEQSLDGD